MNYNKFFLIASLLTLKHLTSCLLMQLKKHLVTASYVDDSTTKLDELAKRSGVTILCEMGLDPGIGNPDPDIF